MTILESPAAGECRSACATSYLMRSTPLHNDTIRTTPSRGQIQRAIPGRVLQRLQPRAIQRAGDARRLQQLWRRQRTGQQPTPGSTVAEAGLLKVTGNQT